MENRFTIEWNIEDLKSALGITEDGVRDIFTDGRNMPSIFKHRLSRDNQGWTPTRGSSHQLLDPDNGNWKVRSITHKGVDFRPSNQIGTGRNFDTERFIEALGLLKGFILFDIACFPTAAVFKIPVQNVSRWFQNGILDSGKVSREKFTNELENDIQFN